MINEAEILQYKPKAFIPELRQTHMAKILDVRSVQKIAAACQLVNASDDIEQRRFSGAGRPHQGDQLSLLDLQGKAIQGKNTRGAFSIYFDSVDQFDHCVIHSVSKFGQYRYAGVL